MNPFIRTTAFFTAASLVMTQPCLAADFAFNELSRDSGTFGAVYLRVPLTGQRTGAKQPEVGLRLGISRVSRGATLGGIDERRSEVRVLDLGIAQSGRKSFKVGGLQLLDKKGHLSLKGDDESRDGISPWLIIGGLVVAAGAGALIWYDNYNCSIDEDTAGECEIPD